jgi:hypothetical protein
MKHGGVPAVTAMIWLPQREGILTFAGNSDIIKF